MTDLSLPSRLDSLLALPGETEWLEFKHNKADPEEIGTYPAEVLVNLLLRLDRGEEAVAVARKHLAQAAAEGRQLSCPGLSELCQRYRAYDTLAEVAREQGDVVHFLAGRIAAGG